MKIYLGIDLGTTGCRVIASDRDGRVVSKAFSSITRSEAPHAEGWAEQDANRWWEALVSSTRTAVSLLRGEIDGVSVDSTSGTVLAVDERGRPLCRALMYNDSRARAEAEILSQAAEELEEKLGYRVSPSFGASKLLWLKRNRSETFRRARFFLHAADFLNGRLTGSFGVTDHTNALKSCFDLMEYRWPDFLEELGIPIEKLPSVVRPGTRIGEVCAEASADTGIPEGTPVYAGLTDGCASQISSGATSPGEWNSTLGSTLVIKGVTRRIVRDPEGRIYSHLHPDGYWMPGGASNCGGECLVQLFGDRDLKAMDQEAVRLIPTGLIIYPLVRVGERFPISSPDARGFVVGTPRASEELYAGYLEGVAYVERMAYEILQGLGAEVGDKVYVAGGGSSSRVWLRIRASVLKKELIRPSVPEAAMGCAILARAATDGIRVERASRLMVREELRVPPDASLSSEYDSSYERFKKEVERRIGLAAST